LSVVQFDVVALPEGDEFGVYARVSEDAALLAVFSTLAAATAFALYQCKTPQSYGKHPDGADGFRPPVAFV
jgi:hypothetical protein